MKKHATITLESTTFSLLQRCALIEGSSVEKIVETLLAPQLQKYSYPSLEEWEEAEQHQQMELMLQQFEQNNNFDPNHIPFDKQVLGLRRKLDEIERELANETASRHDLEELRFKILEDLNLAEKEALEAQQEKRKARALKWSEAAEKYPLD